MARTTAGAVRSILGEGEDGFNYDSVSEPSLTPFIRPANLFVSRVRACAIARNKPLTSEELTEIETWVAAHLYTMMDPTYREKHTQTAKGMFMGRDGMYFDSSRYGQTAVLLDPSGCVAALGNRKSARLVWLGRNPSAQTDFEDRD